MPVFFIISLILLVAAMVSTIVWLNTPKDLQGSYQSSLPPRAVARMVTYGLLVFALLSMIIASATMVSTKTVGVVTSFGKPSGEPLSNGLHFIAPWQKVTEFDAAKQTDQNTGKDHCITVRMAGQTTGCVDNVIVWRAVGDQANSLFQDYKTFDKVRTTLVDPNVDSALNKAFFTFNPLSRVDDGDEVADTADVSAYADGVKAALQEAVGDEIEIVSVTTPYIRYDAATQDRLNELQAEVAKTRVAEQKKLTAAAEAKANKELAASVSEDPNVLVSKCIDLLATTAKDGGSLPNGFSCWYGASVPPVAVAPSK